MDLTLPITDPVGSFFILLGILLLAPMAAEKLRVPGLVGVVLAGILLGPNGLHILAVNTVLETLSTFGLLYIFLEAGLEIDLGRLRMKSGHAAVFGSLTFLIPFILGYGAGVGLFGMKIVPAILLGSLFASNTLLPYPIVKTLGLAESRSVHASAGATAITNILAMLVLGLATAGPGQGLRFWLRTVGILAAWTIAVALILPAVSSRFFRRVKAGGNVEFLFVLVAAFFCAASARLVGIESALGAFAAGVLLKRHIPEQSDLMHRIRFVGDSIFIPLCVLYIGMLSNIPSLATDGRSFLIAGIMILVILVSKFGSSLLMKPFFGFSLAEVNLSFGLSVNQAASALALALVGFRLRLFDHGVLDGTVVMFTLTCILGTAMTRRAAAKLSVENPRDTKKAEGIMERVLIAVSNPATLEPLTNFAFLIRDPESEEPVIPVCVVQDSPNADRDLEQAETTLAQAIARGVAAGVPVRPATRLCLNAAEGVLAAAKEQGATTVLIGWNRAPKPSGAFFGDITDQIVAGGRELTIVARLQKPLAEASALILVIPPFVERNPGYLRALSLLRRALVGVSAKLTVLTLASDAADVRESLQRIRGAAPRMTAMETWKEFPKTIEKLSEGAAFFFLCPKPGRMAWHPALEQLPKTVSELFPDSTLLLFYLPEETGVQEITAAATEETESDATASNAQAADSLAVGPAPNKAKLSEEPPSPPDAFYRNLVKAGRVIPNLSSAAVVDAVRELLEVGFPGDIKRVHHLTGIYSDIAQKQPIELTPGVLLLHAHVDNITEPLTLVGAKAAGWRLLALDEPVRVVVLLCAPTSQSPEDHLRMLSLIAQALKDRNRVERILAAKSVKDLEEK
jgi:Kef-type K+ transport system membrane component KefB